MSCPAREADGVVVACVALSYVLENRMDDVSRWNPIDHTYPMKTGRKHQDKPRNCPFAASPARTIWDTGNRHVVCKSHCESNSATFSNDVALCLNEAASMKGKVCQLKTLSSLIAARVANLGRGSGAFGKRVCMGLSQSQFLFTNHVKVCSQTILQRAVPCQPAMPTME